MLLSSYRHATAATQGGDNLSRSGRFCPRPGFWKEEIVLGSAGNQFGKYDSRSILRRTRMPARSLEHHTLLATM